MFVDKPIGNPLKRKQLKWLLVILGVVMVFAVLLLSLRLIDESVPVPAQPMGDKGVVQAKPSREEIQKQLEMLADADAAPKPAPEEIQKQLDMLAKEDAENPAPKPTQEDIQKQLEALSKE